MSTFLLQLVCKLDNNYSVLIEDDGRVAYAYLLEYGDVIRHVWLYNQEAHRQIVNWVIQITSYLNLAEYLSKKALIAPIKSESELKCEWTEIPNDSLIEVGIYIRNKFIASVQSGSKPGWSALVVKDGPLALVY